MLHSIVVPVNEGALRRRSRRRRRRRVPDRVPACRPSAERRRIAGRTRQLFTAVPSRGRVPHMLPVAVPRSKDKSYNVIRSLALLRRAEGCIVHGYLYIKTLHMQMP